MKASNGKAGLKKPAQTLAAPRAASRPSLLSHRPILKYGSITVAIVSLVALIWGWLYWQSLYRGMPSLPPTIELWEANRDPAIEFLAPDGTTLGIRGPRYGRSVRLDDLPPHVPRAFIAAEDKRFFEHDGADTQAMVRALISNTLSGETVSGASTLTQQLVKNLVLSSDQTLKRKVQEIRLARQLEKRLSKSEILELYLNRVYFGSGFYGLGAASRFYFGKDPQDLTLAEASLLATLPQAPSRLALNKNIEDAKVRQRYVLRQMVDASFVTEESAALAIETEVTLSDNPESDPQLGYLLDAATEATSQLLPALPDDLVITLTVDPALQAKVTEAIESRMDADGETANASQAAAVILNTSGQVLALYGGRDYEISQFNRATMARRQPGSAFKPFVFAAALEAGVGPYDVRVDEPVKIDDWRPKNFSRDYMGPVTVTEALRDSLNTVAAVLGQEAGEDKIIALATKFGLRADMEPLPSIALGSQEMTLWDLTRGYGPFMNGGIRVDPYLVSKVETSRGKTLYQRPDYEPARVYSRDHAELMTAMMTKVVTDGTGQNAAIERWPVAGKTGTSQSSRDAWFIGYTANLLGGVWTGNDDDTPMSGVTGGGLPALLWADMMTIAHQGQSPKRLRGQGRIRDLSPEQMARVTYYRELGRAFAAVSAD